MQRIGVFVCHCGSNIAATVDVAAVAEAAKSQPGVVFATDYTYMCSENGQNLIADSIREYGLTVRDREIKDSMEILAVKSIERCGKTVNQDCKLN